MGLYRCGRDFCNAKEVMAVADAMTTNGMKDVGFQYINLDGMGNLKQDHSIRHDKPGL